MVENELIQLHIGVWVEDGQRLLKKRHVSKLQCDKWIELSAETVKTLARNKLLYTNYLRVIAGTWTLPSKKRLDACLYYLDNIKKLF